MVGCTSCNRRKQRAETSCILTLSPLPSVLSGGGEGEGEIALQHGITAPELAEGVKTGSERLAVVAASLHYTAVVEL